MAMRIEVTAETKKKEGVAKNSGKPYSFALQAALFRLGAEVRQVWLEVRDGKYFPPGPYEFEPTFRVNEYGELALGRAFSLKRIDK